MSVVSVLGMMGIALAAHQGANAPQVVNLVPNGDFSLGNTGFKSDLPYTEPFDNCLWPASYTIASAFNRPQLHRLIAIERFSAPVRRTGKENVFYANAGGVDPLTVWKTAVTVKPHTQYRISFYCASLSGREDGGTPPRQIPTVEWVPNFEIRVNRDVSPEFTAGLGKYYRAVMTWNSSNSRTANLSIVRNRIEHGGGLVAISNIEMVEVFKSEQSDEEVKTEE